MSEIKGLDFDTAMANCGDDEEILRAVLAEMSDEAEGRIIDINRFLAEKNYERYGIDAHAIKGLMATIGLSSLSERAKKHEFAAKEGDLDFIEADHEGFLEEYGSVCDILREI